MIDKSVYLVYETWICKDDHWLVIISWYAVIDKFPEFKDQSQKLYLIHFFAKPHVFKNTLI